ncbi:hypothetical protein NC651_021467 [Populus alba x Populus x berolinensis]|nr:hypothetical protein NC651_021467 [Populus alba x Populus x berolinensis]
MFCNFPALGRRSSVVSIFISLIIDTWATGSHDIKLILYGDEPITVASY